MSELGDILMSKRVVQLLVVLGLFLLLSGFFVFGGIRFMLPGLAILGAGIYLGIQPGGVLRREQVLDSWGILVDNGNGKANEVVWDTEDFILKSNAPAIDIKKKVMTPGVIRGMLGAKREFLVVTVKENLRLSPFQIFINARDYGNNLDVSWYLTYRPSLFQAILTLLPFIRSTPLSLSEFDIFDQQDLIAYTTNCHHSLLKAVEKQILALNQDPTKIERKTRGFLGIS